MKKYLQRFEFRKSNFERINQKWLCGKSTEGKSCAQGPNSNGQCSRSYPCMPIKKADRWYCTRAPQHGGSCIEGPLPDGHCCLAAESCQPLMNLRYKRALITRWCFILTLTLVLFFTGGKLFANFINPGPLSPAHTHINDCTSCHTDFNASKSQWLHQLFKPNDSNDDKACLQCHDLGQHPNKPHGMDIKSISSTSVNMPKTELSCATCHEEHQGNKHPLTKIENSICMSCHHKDNLAFSANHPEFNNYPDMSRYSRLHYDHSKHAKQYFTDEKFKSKAPEDCLSCHRLGPNQKIMRLKPYESTCASCHDNQIKGEKRAGNKGMPFLTVPLVDVATLKEKQINIGQWPKFADEEITSFAKQLLTADPKIQTAFNTLDDITIDDLIDANAEQLKAAADIIWAYKNFLEQLSDQGGHQLATAPEDTVRAMNQAWFPNLKAEVANHIKGTDAVTALLSELPKQFELRKTNFTNSGEEWAKHGGWYWQDYTLYYRPRHHADRFLKDWFDLSAQTDSSSVFTYLTNPKAPGACMKCHTTSENKINWQALVVTTHPLTKYAHSPHIQVKECQACHIKGGENQTTSDFKAIKKAQCQSCHTENKIFENCSSCHSYHRTPPHRAL